MTDSGSEGTKQEICCPYFYECDCLRDRRIAELENKLNDKLTVSVAGMIKLRDELKVDDMIAMQKEKIAEIEKRNAYLELRNQKLEESKTTKVMLDDVKKLFKEAVEKIAEIEKRNAELEASNNFLAAELSKPKDNAPF